MPTDADLIRQCRAGRTAAFGTLIERHQDRLYASVLGMLGSADAATEAVQDAFVLAWQKLDTFEGHAAFSTWLFRIAVNAAFTHLRKRKRQRIITGSGPQTFEPPDLRPEADPAARLERDEAQQLVRNSLDSLPDDYRIVLILKEMEGYRYDEIAELTGVPIGTVRSRLHRARCELREKLRVALKDQV